MLSSEGALGETSAIGHETAPPTYPITIPYDPSLANAKSRHSPQHASSSGVCRLSRPAQVEVESIPRGGRPQTWLRITIGEGKNRQVRPAVDQTELKEKLRCILRRSGGHAPKAIVFHFSWRSHVTTQPPPPPPPAGGGGGGGGCWGGGGGGGGGAGG